MNFSADTVSPITRSSHPTERALLFRLVDAPLRDRPDYLVLLPAVERELLRRVRVAQTRTPRGLSRRAARQPYPHAAHLGDRVEEISTGRRSSPSKTRDSRDGEPERQPRLRQVAPRRPPPSGSAAPAFAPSIRILRPAARLTEGPAGHDILVRARPAPPDYLLGEAHHHAVDYQVVRLARVTADQLHVPLARGLEQA